MSAALSPAECWELFRVAVSARTEWLVLRVGGADGSYGYGECSDAGSLDAVLKELDVLKEFGALKELDGCPGDEGFVAITVRGGLEQARLDREARRTGVPLRRLLTGEQPPQRVELYANINRAPGGRTPREVARVAEAAVRDGFRAVKLAPFDTPDTEGRRTLAEIGLDRVRAVRDAVGDRVDVMVDAHERLTLAELTSLLRPFEELDLHWLEDGVGIGRPAELAELRSRTELPLAGGEFASRAAEVHPVRGLLDVFLPDVKHAGGPRAALELAAHSGTARISHHNPSGPVATLHAAQLTPARLAERLEYAYGEVDWRPDLVHGAERVHDGRLTLTDAPGIGLELDTEHPAVTRVWSGRLEPRPSCRA
ncbi:enolase C-terminal domain-like protein [Streptomyces sp. NPDC046909]|uniref:mandelate racemase/muconate lactonizing enzyme family protein n=1 Tax=Streptomyces sp. NPDC046909 TaxID=3155617 RepID=UPI0033FF73CD